MKKIIILTLTIIPFFGCGSADTAKNKELVEDIAIIVPDNFNYKPSTGYVGNEKVALRIADVILKSIYGDYLIERQKPLKINLRDQVWLIEGTRATKPYNKGGVAQIEISKSTGEILRVSHGA